LQKTYAEVNQRIVFFVDEVTNFVGMLLHVLTDKQSSLLEYIASTYSNVNVFVSENWLRFDFNKDGKVGIDDMRKSLSHLYEFLKSYDYIEATTKIKSTIYEEA
jgi:hypothetical protein